MRINGIPVVDAKKGVRLNITSSDVKKGDNKDPAACAAAQACMRELDATEARVHIGRTYVHVGKQWVRYQTSDALRSEIVAFDRGGAIYARGIRSWSLQTVPKTRQQTQAG